MTAVHQPDLVDAALVDLTRTLGKPELDLVILAEGYGLSHADLIRKLLHIALKRVGLS